MKTDYSEEFLKFWSEYPKRDRPDAKKPAYKRWLARLAEPEVTAELLTSAAREYAAYLRRKGKYGTEFVLTAEVFLGPNERWVPWVPQKPADAPVAPRKPTLVDTAEERANPEEAKAFIRELLQGLATAKKSPLCNYVRSDRT